MPVDLVSRLVQHGREIPDQEAVVFVRTAPGGLVEEPLTYGELDRRARAVASWLRERCDVGDRVLLLYGTGPDFVTVLAGCMYAGVVAVPAPQPSTQRGHSSRSDGIVRDADVRLVLTDSANHETAAGFRTWHRHLPDDVEVLAACYPGRQDRLRDPFHATVDELVTEVVEAIEPLLDVPVALFGHSMGALIAHEVAVRLDARHDTPPPVRLFVSGSEAPHLIDHAHLREADDTGLLETVRQLGSSGDHFYLEPLESELLGRIRAHLRTDLRLRNTLRGETDRRPDHIPVPSVPVPSISVPSISVPTVPVPTVPVPSIPTSSERA